MLRLHQVDTVTANELKNMQEVLVSKETEVVQSESTAKGLTTGQVFNVLICVGRSPQWN